MAVYLSPGVFPTEIDLSVLPTASGPLRPAFIGTAKKGPMNQAVFITGAAQALETFGEPFPESYLMYAVLTFLEEGNQCYIMRVGVECRVGQDAALDQVCIDTSGGRGKGWGRIPLFSGIDFGRINLRAVSAQAPASFHAASYTIPEYNDVNISQTDGPTSATMTVTGTYTGLIHDSFAMVITGPPTGASPVNGATYQLVRNSDGSVAVEGTLTSGQAINLGNGLSIQIAVSTGRLDTNDTFLFESTPDNRKFTVVVEGDENGAQRFTMPNADYTSATDLVAAFNALVGNNAHYLMVQQTLEDGTVVPQLRTTVEGQRIQIGFKNAANGQSGAWAFELGKQQYEWDIPRSYLIGLDSGPFAITTGNNRVSIDIIGKINTKNIVFNLPIGLNQTPLSIAQAIHSAGTDNGQRYFESFSITLPDGTDHVVIATPTSAGGEDHSIDTLFLQSSYSNLKTLRFAEELEIPFPYKRSYRGTRIIAWYSPPRERPTPPSHWPARHIRMEISVSPIPLISRT